MSRTSFALLILWMFGTAAAYGAIAFQPVIRDAFFQWLGFFALVMAPAVYLACRELAPPASPTSAEGKP